MILLDAGVLVALNDPRDAHHAQATRFLDANIDERLASTGVTLAESLVYAVKADVLDEVIEDYEAIGITPLDVPGGAAGTIARIRAETRLRMPDALVVYSCEREGAELATTDVTLARVATARGIRTHLLADH